MSVFWLNWCHSVSDGVYRLQSGHTVYPPSGFPSGSYFIIITAVNSTTIVIDVIIIITIIPPHPRTGVARTGVARRGVQRLGPELEELPTIELFQYNVGFGCWSSGRFPHSPNHKCPDRTVTNTTINGPAKTTISTNNTTLGQF